MTLVYELAHQMPLRDVCGLVRHDSRQFILVASCQDQAALDGDESSGHGEGIDDGVLQHEVIELVLAFLGVARQAVADFLDVILDLRVFEDHAALPHAGKPPQTRLILILERYRGGRGAAQIRQILIDGARTRAQPRARSPAHADD